MKATMPKADSKTEGTVRQSRARPRARRRWYRFVRAVCFLAAKIFFRYQSLGSNRVPESGPLLLLSNHQSNLDPVLVGIGTRRPVNSLARQTLFDTPGLAWMIRSLDAIPIDRDGLGLAGLKETLRRLRRDEAVLLFPEGRRSDDGQLAALKPGVCALARRGRATLVPVGIDGAFEAWPRRRRLPRPGRIWVCYGEPIDPETVSKCSDTELLDLLSERIRECQAAARARRKPGGDSP